MMESHYTVSDVARLAHVSVRTLHHYDDIGLLRPAARSAAGYRLYSDADLLRLRDILLFRELALPLEAIRPLLDAPAGERARALREQRTVLQQRLRSTHAVLRAVDAVLDAMEGEATMDTGRIFDGFDEFDHAKYAEEAEQRWGDTDAWRESQRRTKQYTKEDWARIREEGDGIMARFAALMAAGDAPSSDVARAAAEDHRMHISRWFYPCDRSMHAALAEMYVADARFGEYFESRAPGLTEFVAAAIRANSAS